MVLRKCFCVMAATLSMCPTLLSGQPAAKTGIWAAAGQRLDQTGSPRQIQSPNKALAVRESNGSLVVVARNRTTAIDAVPATPPLTEVLWAPDSLAFVVNASDGGVVGTWDAYLYSVADGAEPTARDLRRLVESQTQGIARCTTDEVLNLGAIGWREKSRELLVLAEVPPHSSCQNPGAIFGFRVSVQDWKVLERIPETQVRSAWAQFLGPRLMR